MTFSSLHCYRGVTILCLMGWFLFDSVLGWGQAPCGMPSLTAAQMQQLSNQGQVAVGGSPRTYQIPVRVTVFRTNNGTEFPMPQTQTDIDNALITMNNKLNIGLTNTFQFVRCGEVNIVNSTQLYHAGLNNLSNLPAYSPQYYTYQSGCINMYIYNGALRPFAHFPNDIIRPVHLTAGPEISSGTFFHELGHTVGLIHTFEGRKGNGVNPYDPAERELVIRVVDPSKEHSNPNFLTHGDLVGDTPAACSFEDNIYGSTCDYIFPPTCAHLYTTTSWRDANNQLVDDPTNSLIKNYMGYHPGCSSEFTAGQRTRADIQANNWLKPLYDTTAVYSCTSSLTATDNVEIEGTNTPLNRVRIFSYDRPLAVDPTLIANATTLYLNGNRNYSFTINNKDNGSFSMRLFPRLNQAGTGRVQFTKIVRHKLDDVAQFDTNWSVNSDVQTTDVAELQSYLLAITPLTGYKIIAADANKSNSLTNLDVIELQKLINGTYSSGLPGFPTPWRFIPEMVTQNLNGTIQNNFNGGTGFDDNPFNTTFPGSGGATFSPSNYCKNEWNEPNPWLYTVSTKTYSRGFDAVRIGNVAGNTTTTSFDDEGVISERTKKEECEGDVVMIVPKANIKAGETVQLIFRGYEFKDVSAIQMGLRASKEDFDFVKIETSTLDNFLAENCLGGLNIGNDNLKLVWVDDKVNAKNLKNRDALFTITLKTKRNITDLSTVLYLDDEILETYFLSFKSGCKKDVSLEIEVKIPQRLDQEAKERGDIETPIALHCVPNPASSTANLVFDAQNDFEGNIAIQDNFGKVVKVLPYTFKEGRNVIAIPDFSELPVGILTIIVKDAQQQHTVRVVKY
jgi:hypothetical protein